MKADPPMTDYAKSCIHRAKVERARAADAEHEADLRMREAIRTLRNERFTIRAISELLGVPFQAVYRRCDE